MFKRVFAVVAAALLVLGIAMVTVAGAAKRHTFKFVEHITGAGVTSTQSVYKVHDSHFGNGAGVQNVKISGLGGTDTETTYYGNASARSRGTFKLSTPNAQGISTLTGQGHDIGGTGRLRGFRSSYTYTGTYNTKTTVFTVTLRGTGSTP
jgi:hypothetical protein